jgi:hypothetical protein
MRKTTAKIIFSATERRRVDEQHRSTSSEREKTRNIYVYNYGWEGMVVLLELKSWRCDWLERLRVTSNQLYKNQI